VDKEHVWLRRNDDKVVRVAFSALSNTDQDYATHVRQLNEALQPSPDVPTDPSTAASTRLSTVQGSRIAQKIPNGNVLAQAIGYYTGTSGRVDHAAAARLFTKAAASNDPLAQMWLAKLLYQGEPGFELNKQRAQELAKGSIDDVKRLAHEGNVEAMFLYATAPTDGLTAVQWYRKAAEQGNTMSQWQLGKCYELGVRGLKQDSMQAIEWYRKAADQGNAIAQNELGMFYKEGAGAEQDRTQAAKWFRKAAERGYYAAQYNLGLSYTSGELGVEQDPKLAAEWYRKAAEQGLALAQYNLGNCYFNGLGVEQDRREAARLWRLAAAQGHESANHNLAILSSPGPVSGYQPPHLSQSPLPNYEQQRNEQERKYWQERNEHQINEQRRAAAQYQRQAQGR
jgi:TPR repeat protein